jgi:hypothetical protein
MSSTLEHRASPALSHRGQQQGFAPLLPTQAGGRLPTCLQGNKLLELLKEEPPPSPPPPHPLIPTVHRTQQKLVLYTLCLSSHYLTNTGNALQEPRLPCRPLKFKCDPHWSEHPERRWVRGLTMETKAVGVSAAEGCFGLLGPGGRGEGKENGQNRVRKGGRGGQTQPNVPFAQFQPPEKKASHALVNACQICHLAKVKMTWGVVTQHCHWP